MLRGSPASVAQAFAVLVASPAFACFCTLSWLNQTWRTCCGVFGVEPGDAQQCTSVAYEPEDWDSAFTPPCRKMLARLRRWRWANVLECTMWLGLFFLMFNVGVGKVRAQPLRCCLLLSLRSCCGARG